MVDRHAQGTHRHPSGNHRRARRNCFNNNDTPGPADGCHWRAASGICRSMAAAVASRRTNDQRGQPCGALRSSSGRSHFRRTANHSVGVPAGQALAPSMADHSSQKFATAPARGRPGGRGSGVRSAKSVLAAPAVRQVIRSTPAARLGTPSKTSSSRLAPPTQPHAEPRLLASSAEPPSPTRPPRAHSVK